MLVAAVLVCLGAPSLYSLSPADIDSYVSGLHEREPRFETRLAEVAERSLGTPYATNGPLGEGPDGKYDKDPLADYTKVDCVTFVEQSIALAASDSYEGAFALLQRIRYKDGRIDYEMRNHFMETDWFPNNAFCRDVTGEVGVPTATLTRTISRRDFFKRVKAPELGQDTPDQNVDLAYIPSARVAEAEGKIPTPSVVCFVGKTDWLFAVHCGLFVRDANGRGRLYHASTQEGKVVSAKLSDYVRDSPRFLGITVHAIAEPLKKGGRASGAQASPSTRP